MQPAVNEISQTRGGEKCTAFHPVRQRRGVERDKPVSWLGLRPIEGSPEGRRRGSPFYWVLSLAKQRKYPVRAAERACNAFTRAAGAKHDVNQQSRQLHTECA
ncbi:hypothetical protein JHS3_30340 [Jeongeupia sp. HS-3]|nr:hypothetical protein JHS3_30340 [Jeongeupia sp. HS-3]